MTDRKAMTSSALRRRRQAIKAERAKLKRELAAIEAEMERRKWAPGAPIVTITRQEAEELFPAC